MKIITELEDITKNDNCVMTIGTFDGVHLGHQAIIKKLLSEAAEKNVQTTVVTFEPHPQFVVNPERQTKLRLLTTLEEKINIFEKQKIDRLVILPFTKELSEVSSTDFIENILVHKIGFRSIIIGYDHAFGKSRSGNYFVLKSLQAKHGYSILQMEPFSANDIIISSTKIRKMISEGDVAGAEIFLGRHYQMKGKVIYGEGRGKRFATPTANFLPLSDKKIIPQNGIYAGWTIHEGKKVESVIYIGTKPTFNYGQLSIEIHLFQFNENLYDKPIEIAFKQKIRDDVKFESKESLYRQIEIDKQMAMEILSKN